MLGILMMHYPYLMIPHLFNIHHFQHHAILMDNHQILEQYTSNHGLLLMQIKDLMVGDIIIHIRTNPGLESIWKEGMLISIQSLCHTVNFFYI